MNMDDRNFFGKGKTRKSCRKPDSSQDQTMQNGTGKSVFGRWLKDLRSGQNREAGSTKTHRPLGRTLSANVKDKDRKRKIGRTLSASHKDRKKDARQGEEEEEEIGGGGSGSGWDSGIFHTRAHKSFAGDENGTDEVLTNGTRCRDRSFSNPSLERFGKRKTSPEINRKALVSYLDEEGLKAMENTDKENDETSISQNKSRRTTKQDGSIMPTSSLHKKPTSTTTNHYENHESLLLNERNKNLEKEGEKKTTTKKETDYPEISYGGYGGKAEIGKGVGGGGGGGFNYYNDHRYENLETTDYISWSSSDKTDGFEYDLLEEGGGGGEGKRKKDEREADETAVVEKKIECSFRFGYGGGGGVGDWCGGQDVPEAPVRDPSSLKSIKYGPGHEKYPSWPGSVRAETGEKPQRSHSWTDQTSYPKEKVTSYARPHSKRTNPAFTQQLKTVMERCEKITPETFQKTMEQVNEREKRVYLPRVDREGKSLGDQDYMVPSPPERDKPSLTQADLEKYYQDSHLTKIDNGDYSTPYEDMHKASALTQADLEEYARSYDEVLKPHHQHQGSYAQSEGYHSYVSSSELTTTPFLDRLRRDSDSGIRSQQWSEEDGRAGRDSVVTTSSGSASSSETLKWHGSMSDVSVASSSCRSRQLIAHSSRVPPPQRHHSESVLYLGTQGTGNWQGKGDRSQQLKLFPVNTYTVQPNEQSKPVISPTSVPKMSVAERISELEKQQQAQRFAYYDPEKRHKISDPTLKAIQKKALLSFYERHQHTTGVTTGMSSQGKLQESWKSESQGQPVPVQEVPQRNAAPPPPPPRPVTSRRASCASDLSLTSWGKTSSVSQPVSPHSCSLLGPVIVGPSISIDDWVPELPPKKPHLRTIPPPLPHRSPSPVQVPPIDAEMESLHFHKSLPSYDRMPTPDLPPPPPPPAPEDEAVTSDEPLPPPPPEVEWHLATAVPRRSTPMSSGPASPQSPDEYSPIKDCSEIESSGMLEQNENVRTLLIPDAYEIQYDQDAINAIMESNRMAELQKKKHSKSKHEAGKEHEDKSSLKVHIENRPPLPLPRDVHNSKHEGCDRGPWQKPKDSHNESKIPFVRSFSKQENGTRGSVKGCKNEARTSLRFPSKKVNNVNGRARDHGSPERCPSGTGTPKVTKSSGLEHAKPFTVKKVSEYECRIPIRDRDGLTVFETTAIDDGKMNNDMFANLQQPSKGSNSKAAFLALRREKELGMTNCEGSYKLTVSPSGETIDTSNSEKSPLEMAKLKERLTENLVLDNRLTLEPPDLIPKMTNLNRKSSSVQDVRNNRKKYEYNRQFSNDKYRLLPVVNDTTANNNNNNNNSRLGMFGENIIQNECRVTFGSNKDNKPKDGYEKEPVSKVTTTTVECVRAVIAKLESEPAERLDQQQRVENYQSQEPSPEETNGKEETESEGDEKYGISFTLSRTAEPEKDKTTPSLLRVRSNVEKRLSRSDSMKSNEGKVERSKSLKLVERSTSFGRTDTMRVIGVVERSEGKNVNLSVSDASSQTDLLEEEPVRDEAAQKKLEEEMECERLSRDLASHLSPSDKLQSLLVPDSERKKPTDYVAGLFRLELSSKPRRHFAKKAKKPDDKELTSGDSSPQEIVVNGVTSNQNERTEDVSSGSSFLSASKSKISTKLSESATEPRDTRQLQKKKEELMARLDRKLEVLKEEQEALTNDSKANEELGATVASSVAKSARPHELAKYRLHVEEVGKITSLLLGLSGRLAKTENALLGLPSHHDDRKIHESKRDKLQEQLAEAKQLKENIDKRSDSVAKTLGKYLNADEYADYVHFIRMKAKLIVDLREIADKISLSEEQLAALKETTMSS